MRRSAALAFAVLLALATSVPVLGADAPHLTGRLFVPTATQLGGAWGMAFDAQDNLWVGNIDGRAVTQIDPDSGRVLARYDYTVGAEGADDVAVDPVSGAVYYTGILSGEVGRIGPDGTVSVIANLGMGVNPITFSDDGRLFVGKAFMSDGVWEMNPATGAILAEIMPETGNPASSLNGFDWYDGYLYAPRPDAGKVVRIDPVPDGAITELASGLVYPHAVDLAPDGTIYVAAADGTYTVDPESGATTLVTPLVADNLAIDSGGRLFASGGIDGGVYRILPNGKPLTISPPGLSRPLGTAATMGAGGNEVVYVADKFALYGFNGRTGRQILRSENVPMVDTVAADGENLIITSGFGNAVWVWNPATGAPVSVYTFGFPMNAIRFDGDIIVAELGSGQVLRMDEAAPSVRTPLAQLAIPTGLGATDDDLYVSDLFMGVFRLVHDGVATFEPILTDLQGPEGIAVLPDGDLLVVETWARRLLLVDVDTTPATVTVLLEDLAVGTPGPDNLAPGWLFDGVSVGPSGAIYLGTDAGLFRYELHR